ncbi:MAG: PAS domain S-box protein [Chitinophagaceae bacterium]|nr:PAS domain S-box protein [Chitinophagaceae bacterium]
MQKQLKILLVEDNRTDAEMIERLLRKEVSPCECRLATNKQNFINLLTQFTPDVIISDNSLPNFSAGEALKIVRDQGLELPFILVTGTVSEEFAADIIKQGADDYILKDRMARLPAAIDAAVVRRRIEKEKQEAARKLRQSEEQYRTMMERVSDAFVSLDRNWRYTYVNIQAGEILKRRPEELLGKHIWTEFPEGIGQPFYKAYHHALAAQQYIHLEEYFTPFDIWLENHIYPSPDGLSIFFRDITPRKKAEQMVIQTKENLKAIFNNSSEGFVLLDEFGTIKALNERAGESILASIDSSPKTGRSIFDFVEPARMGHFKTVLSTVLQGEIVQYDRPLQTNGQLKWFTLTFNPVRKEERIKGICITCLDITDKKQIEEEREFDHNNLNALINNTRDLMWSVDREMKLITFNHAFEDLVKSVTGEKPQKGINVLDFAYSTDLQNRYAIYYERALAGESFTETEYSENPVEFWSEISFYPIYEKGQVIGTACFARNITDRKKAEKQLHDFEWERLNRKLNEQKKIGRAVLRAQEKERNAIGMELHDNVNQLLVSTNLILSVINDCPEKNSYLLPSCIDQLKQAIEENRKIAHSYASPNLETENLLTQLEKLCQNMLGASGINTVFNADDFQEESLDADKKFNIYRIMQEQCTNIVKYAAATDVIITLTTNPDIFLMSIADNGKGTDNVNTAGIGLRNMNERLKLFDGSSRIITEPGQGFTLEITIPLKEKNQRPEEMSV